MPECIGMEMLFSFQVFNRKYKIRRGIINFASLLNLCKKLFSENQMPVFVEIQMYTKTTHFHDGKDKTP